MIEPLVSVIIPTYNSERTLPKCLKSIKNQTYKNVEFIVVDNYSADKTRKIAEEYDAKVFQLNAERSKAKNFGLKNATGKYICFIDSDMELTNNVIEECVNLIEKDEKIGGIIIPERSVGNSFWVKVRDFERSFYAGTEIESARFFRKDLAEKAGGFDEDVIFFEESTLSQRIEKLGYNVKVRVNAEILHHEEVFSVWNWLKKKYYYGKTASIYRKKYKDLSCRQMSLFYRFGLFFRNKRFYSKPLLAFGVVALKLLEYFLAGLGFLAGKVRKRHAHELFHRNKGEVSIYALEDTFRKSPRRMFELKIIQLLNKGICLDAGCGTGIYLPFFSHASLVIGLDLDVRALKLAKKNSTNNCEIVRGDVRHLPFRQVFNFIWSSHVIEHLTPQDGKLFIEELKRTIKNGWIAVTTPNGAKLSGVLGALIISNRVMRRLFRPLILETLIMLPRARKELLPVNSELAKHRSFYTSSALKKWGFRVYGYGFPSVLPMKIMVRLPNFSPHLLGLQYMHK